MYAASRSQSDSLLTAILWVHRHNVCSKCGRFQWNRQIWMLLGIYSYDCKPVCKSVSQSVSQPLEKLTCKNNSFRIKSWFNHMVLEFQGLMGSKLKQLWWALRTNGHVALHIQMIWEMVLDVWSYLNDHTLGPTHGSNIIWPNL